MASPEPGPSPSQTPAANEEENSDSGLIKGVTRILTDGYYGASYIPDQSGMYFLHRLPPSG